MPVRVCGEGMDVWALGVQNHEMFKVRDVDDRKGWFK
jgi:hypothetical protein